MKCELAIVAATVLAMAGVFRRLPGTPVTPRWCSSGARSGHDCDVSRSVSGFPYRTAGVTRIGRPGVTASMCEQHRPRVGMQVRWDDPGREARFRLVRRAQRHGTADQDGRRLAGRWPPGHRSQNLVVRRSGHRGVRRHGVGVRHVRGPLRAPPRPTGVTQPTRATPPFRAPANAHRRCVPHLRGLCDTVIRPRRARWCLHLGNKRFHLRRQPQACDRLGAIRSSRSGRPIAPAYESDSPTSIPLVAGKSERMRATSPSRRGPRWPRPGQLRACRDAPVAEGRARIKTQAASTGRSRCSSAARGSAPTTRSIS